MTPRSWLVQPARMQEYTGITMSRPMNAIYDRELLQMEEQRLTAALTLVRRNLNDLLPISKLPPEIMEHIFQICASWLYGPRKPKHRLAWTQVCCSWRFISLNSSKLWQRIDLADARLTEECLARSKRAPLSVESSSPVHLAADNLGPHAHRIRSINICLYPPDFTHLLSIVGSNPSSLTYLSLKVPPSTPPSSVTLHPDIPLRYVRHLSLDGVSVRWEDCRDLTHLEIRGLVPESCPSISQLHGVFARSPELENVRLVNLVTSCLKINPGPSIPLYHIKDMMLSSEQDILSAILSGVKLGPSSRLRLHTSRLTESLFDLFPGGLPHSTKPHAVIHIPIVRLSSHGIQLSRHGTPTWSESSDEPTRLLSVSSTETGMNFCDSLRYLIDLSFVTKLELNHSVLMHIPKEDLSNLFANLYCLETLCTAFNDLEDLFNILQHSSPSSRGSYLCLPRLIGLSFSKPAHMWWNFADRWLPTITECAKFRKLSSHPIQTIEFLRCHKITTASTKQLRNFVPRVVISERMSSRSCL